MPELSDASEHQELIDHIKCEMGEGGPQVVSERGDKITFRTLAHKERTIIRLADALDYQPFSVDLTRVDGWDMVEVCFT